jgi:DNA-binding XRE family transcriptional regulator
MTQTTSATSGYSRDTVSFRIGNASKAPEAKATPDPLIVICVDNDISDQPVPAGFVSWKSRREVRTRDPARVAMVEVARQRVANAYFGEADTLKAFRMAHGLSQQGLADRLGSTQPYVSRVERNPSSAGVSFMRRLCESFGIDMNRANELLR